MLTTQTVHFSVGENAGVILMEIAQEHLIYEFNPEKALKALTDSLAGCPDELAVRILKGDMVLPVDVENQQFICQKRIPVIHDVYPKIDVLEFAKRNCAVIKEASDDFYESYKLLQYRMKRDNNIFGISFSYEKIFKFIAGNDEVLLDELHENEDLSAIDALIDATKKFIERSVKVKSILDWMIKSFKIDTDDQYLEIQNLQQTIGDCLMKVMQGMQVSISGTYLVDSEVDELQDYIDSAMEIQDILSTEIQPVNILDKYSAGWLSPEGDFYGLNGEIANMLHQQIADALQAKGIIPADEDVHGYLSSDAWLEQHGWVKIHGDNVQFGGCLNSQIGLVNVDMTNVQVDMIYQYGQQCCNMILSMGWRHGRITATMFKMMSKNMAGLNKKYFEF